MSGPTTPALDQEAARKRHRARELEAAKTDLYRAVASHIEHLVDHWSETEPMPVNQAVQLARSPLPGEIADRPADQISWFTLSNLLEQDHDAGLRAWEAIRQEAKQELETGTRVSRSLETPGRSGAPFERARFLAILNSFEASLQPSCAHEHLLVQMIAAAYEQWIRWQTIATQRIEVESCYAERDRHRNYERLRPAEREAWKLDNGWIQPRLSDAAAIEEAVLYADRFQRQLIRGLRTLRDMRRVIGSVTMLGGQLNVAERQIVNPGNGEGKTV